MKLKNLLIVTLFLGLSPRVHACPTCASSLEDYTPPFFSEEFYQPQQKKAVNTQEIVEEGEENEEGNDTDVTVAQ